MNRVNRNRDQKVRLKKNFTKIKSIEQNCWKGNESEKRDLSKEKKKNNMKSGGKKTVNEWPEVVNRRMKSDVKSVK